MRSIELLGQVKDRESFLAFAKALVEERELAEKMEREEPEKYRLGGALGLLVGGLFGLPVVGIAAGALVGIRKGRQQEIGIDDKFLKSIGDEIESGGSAIVVLFDEGADTARAAASLAQYGGTVHSTDLPEDVMVRFQAQLDESQKRVQTSSDDDAPAE